MCKFAFQPSLNSETEPMTYERWVSSLALAKNIVENIRVGNEKMKKKLPAACFQAYFSESIGAAKYNKGKRGRWREQKYAYLSALAVIDVDHLDEDPRDVFASLQADYDFKAEGILLIYISARGHGMKIVFRVRPDWGNLICQQYEMAQHLGLLDYVDDACKDASRLSFLTGPDDVLYIEKEGLFPDAELFSDERTDFDLRFGERYRNDDDSSPSEQKWVEFEAKRRKERKGKSKTPKAVTPTPDEAKPAAPVSEKNNGATISDRESAIIRAMNRYYGPSLEEGRRHATMTQQTSHWLLWLVDNNAEKAIDIALRLDWVVAWKDRQADEVENIIKSASQKMLLKSQPRELTQLLQAEGIDMPKEEAFIESQVIKWSSQIEELFGVYPCMREACEPHPRRLWPFIIFAASALFGTLMTLCYWRFYDRPEKRRRLNYNVLGVGDPASGKGALERIVEIISEPIARADALVIELINQWKEQLRQAGANKEKPAKPKGILRLHGARTSNNVFINDMINSWVEIGGERWQLHMLTTDTEALNSIKMQRGGSWIDKQVMEIKSWSNEKDSQQFGNVDSVSGFFNVYWNLVRTCTPLALSQICNDANFGTGYPTRLSAIPIPGTGFKMLELHQLSPEQARNDETLSQWAFRMDKRQGELPLWPLVEHCWHWTNTHMEIAAYNNDKADELLLKRIAQTTICIVAPWVDMRHTEEREQNGTYEVDETDKKLLDLLLNIQYSTQHYFFGTLAQNYFDQQMKDATKFRRRTTRFERCFQLLPQEFTTEQFTATFGYANAQSAAKTITRLLDDNAIERTKRGEYRKRVETLN